MIRLIDHKGRAVYVSPGEIKHLTPSIIDGCTALRLAKGEVLVIVSGDADGVYSILKEERTGHRNDHIPCDNISEEDNTWADRMLAEWDKRWVVNATDDDDNGTQANEVLP